MQTRVRAGLAFFFVALACGDVPVFGASPQPAATQLLPTPPATQPTHVPDARRMVDLEKPGVPVYLDAELPVSIDVRALIPAGKYRARVLHPYRGSGWRLFSAFGLQPTSAVFGEGCPSTYGELKAVFDSPTADEALRRRATFVARNGVCPKLDAMFNRQTELLAPELVYGITPVTGKELKLTVERIDDAGQVLQTYEWPLLPPVITPVVTETQWIVTEIAARMADYSTAGAGLAVTSAKGVPSRFEVKGASQRLATPLDVGTGPWNPANYVSLAPAVPVSRRVAKAPAYPNDVAEALTTPTIENLLAVNRELGTALRSDPRNPANHEASALLLVTVALRAANTGLEDIRPLMNRAVAHLALATAGGRQVDTEGDLALAALDALGGRQVAAATRLSTSRARFGSGSARSWHRALTMRATGDWRVYSDAGSPSLLEQVEHTRALTRSWSEERAAAFRRKHGLNRESALWARAILNNVTSIELGHELVMPRLAAEQAEAAVLAKFFGDDDFAHWLQAKGETRGLDPISPDLWARLAEGSLADAAWKVGLHLDGLPPSPQHDLFRARFVETLPRSLAVQALDVWWKLMKPMPVPDRACVEVAQQIKEDAFRLSVRLYGLAAQACNALQRRFPAIDARIAPWTLAGTLFDHRNRLEVMPLLPSAGAADWGVKRRLTFYDSDILAFVMGRVERQAPTAADYRAFHTEMSYSLALLRDWRNAVQYRYALEPGRAACNMELEECQPLIDLLRAQNLEEEAFSTATRLYSPGRELGVQAAAGTAWVIDELVRRGRLAEARDIADRAASTCSYCGRLGQARLAERSGEMSLAERLYAQIDEAYEKTEVENFRMRRLFRQNKDRVKAAKTLAGFGQPTLLRMNPGKDVAGLIANVLFAGLDPVGHVQTERMGLTSADLIVKVNGFDIANERQFWAVLSLHDSPNVELTVVSDSPPGRRVLRGAFWHVQYDQIAGANMAAR